MPRIALTGTPGVGKTTLAQTAHRRLGWAVVDVLALARRTGCIVGQDADGTDVVDTQRLTQHVAPATGDVLYDGHLSHLLGLDAAWVVRCDPSTLGRRLAKRGYGPQKVAQNGEAEALDLILQEALDAMPCVIARDATHRAPDDLLDSFLASPLARPGASGHDVETVDWLSKVE